MKISKGFIEVQMVDKDSTTGSSRKLNLASTLEGLVLCPFCSTTITAIQTNFSWDVSGFECHLEVVHLHQKKHIENQNINQQVKENGLAEVTTKSLQKKKYSRENILYTSNNETPSSKSSNQKKLVPNETHASNGSSDICFEEKEHQSFCEVLKESVRTLKFEKRSKNGTLKSNCSSINHDSKRQSNELLGRFKLKLVEVKHKIKFYVKI